MFKLFHKLLVLITILVVIPLAILAYISVTSFDLLGTEAITHFDEMSSSVLNASNAALQDLGKIVIRNQAISIRNVVEQFLISNPEMTVDDLLHNEEFQNITLLTVGDTGYTLVVTNNKQELITHPNKALVGRSLISWKDREDMQEWWSIVRVIYDGGNFSEGYYQWPEADGSYGEKYMYMAKVHTKTADNIDLAVSATTYMDEFTSPTTKLASEFADLKENIGSDFSSTKTNVEMSTLGVILFTLILTLVSAFIFAKSLVKPISELSDSTKVISKGDYSKKIMVDSNDEIGSLASDFNKMRNDVRSRTKSLKDANKRIQNLSDVKTKFVNQVAHDLRTPLTPISTILPIVRKQIRKGEVRQVGSELDTVISNVKYLTNLVDNTLNISKIDSGNLIFNMAEVDIHDLIEESIESNITVLSDSSMKVINNVASTSVLVDSMRIKEVLNNIISNSIKYRAQELKIVFTSRVTGKFLEVVVQDNGLGIQKKSLNKVFEEFYRADSSRHDTASSGLGLSICKRIINIHGGEIWATSKGLGKGTQIHFTIPLAKKKKA